MDNESVLQKTAKGREEIEKRTFRVDARRRTLLILIDGRASAGELADKAAHIPDVPALLQSLIDQGFVESLTGEAPAAPAQPAAATNLAGASLDELRRNACRQVERLMGPDGDAIALKLERAATMQEFLAQAQKTREILLAFLGPRKAEEFWKSLGL